MKLFEMFDSELNKFVIFDKRTGQEDSVRIAMEKIGGGIMPITREEANVKLNSNKAVHWRTYLQV